MSCRPRASRSRTSAGRDGVCWPSSTAKSRWRTCLTPEITIAEEKGLRKLASGEFRTLFWVAPGIPASALGAYFRALRSADSALRSEPGRYMHLWKNNIPPGLEGDYDWSKFGLGEVLVFEKYPESTFAETLEFARRWGLDKNVRADTYKELAAPVSL